MLGERPQAVGDGVAGGLVARHHQQDEERRELLRAELLAVDLAGHQSGDQVVAGILDAGLAQFGHELGQLGPRGEDGRGHTHRVLDVVDVLGVGEAEDDVRVVEHELLLAAGDAHHVEDDPQRQPRRHVGDEVGLPALGHLVDDLGGHTLDVGLHQLQLPGREAARHDAAHAGVPGVVHVDHRPEEVVEVGRQVGDVRALARAEQVGVPAGLDDVGVAGHGVVGRLRQPHVGQPGEDHGRDRALGAQGGEGRLALLERTGPEVEVGEVDVVNRRCRRHGPQPT
jgi:hypothetical protein